jgi:plasmid stability protein
VSSTNLTLTVDEDLLRQARIRALEQGTSVNAVVREYLEHYVGASTRAGIAGFLELAGRARASSGPGGRSWSRDELHAR